MSQQRDTATDRLANVIEVIQMGRKTGQLTVERGEGITFEEGLITFISGKVTQANAGKRNGLEAFNWLRLWGACHFAFIPSAPQKETSPLPEPSPRPASIRPLPSDTDPTLKVPASLGMRQISSSLLSNTKNNNLTPNTPVPIANTPLPASNIPIRLKSHDEALRMIERFGLSRTHRHLFLLVDGVRNSSEIVRLMGRNQEDVYRLLSDLEHAGLIR